MKKIAAGKFKVQSLRVMEQEGIPHEPGLITKGGRPLAKLIPAEKTCDDFIGRLEGIFTIVGDVESPVVPVEDWGTLR